MRYNKTYFTFGNPSTFLAKIIIASYVQGHPNYDIIIIDCRMKYYKKEPFLKQDRNPITRKKNQVQQNLHACEETKHTKLSQKRTRLNCCHAGQGFLFNNRSTAQFGFDSSLINMETKLYFFFHGKY